MLANGRALAVTSSCAFATLPVDCFEHSTAFSRPASSTCRSHSNVAAHASGKRPQATTVHGDLGYLPPEYTADPVERCRALVLDSTYRPINVVNWQRAIILDFAEKVDVLEYYNTAVQSARSEHFIPAVMRVRAYVKRETRCGRLALSRRNLAIRDMWTCQYCGSKEKLTVDHVIPTAAGGKWSWDNLVTACTLCNCRKGSKSVEQLGWKLRKRPQEPSPYEFGILLGLEMGLRATPKEWAAYLLPFNRKKD